MLFFFLLDGSGWMIGSVIFLLLGILLFLFQLLRTVLKRKPVPPPKPPFPDYSILHVLVSFLWLICSAITGVFLLYSDSNDAAMRVAITYGFMALVCSMSQIIVGMRPKLFSVFTWYHVFIHQKSTNNLPRPIDMGNRNVQSLAFLLWTIATILFAVSLRISFQKGILVASILLAVGVIAGFLNERTILQRIN